jgi:hypothetical protein
MKHLEHTAYPIELIHELHRDWGAHHLLFGIPRIHPSWLTMGPGSDTTEDKNNTLLVNSINDKEPINRHYIVYNEPTNPHHHYPTNP